MAVHLGLVVDTEFLRLVLRQLVRRMPGIALVGEASSLAEARVLPGADALVVDVAACGSDSDGFAALCRMFPGRVVLVGDGETVARTDLVIPRDVVQIPMGTATAARDFSQLATRLQAALGSLGGVAPRVDSPVARRSGRVQRPELVLIAASTGGPEALQVLFEALHEPVCPVVIALHIPAEHCGGLARHLASATGHRVVVGEAGPLPAAGIVLLQGGMDHLVAVRGDGLWLRRAPAAASVFHPNGDVLLGSGAALDRAVVGVVLTGMGNDGCAGAKALAAGGYPVLAQTPASCAVPGMPAAAIAAGAVREVASLTGIADRLNAWFALPVPG
jgi:two-component system chemotaxis response regulator CheB